MATFVLAIENLITVAPVVERVALDSATWVNGRSIEENGHITACGSVVGELTFEQAAQVSKSTLDLVYGPLRPRGNGGRVTVEFGAAMVDGAPYPLLGATASTSELATEVYLVPADAIYTGFVIIRRMPDMAKTR